MLVLRLLVMVLTIICLMDGHAEVSSSTTGIRDRRESPAVKTNEQEVEILDRKKKKKPKPGKKKKPKPGKKKKPNQKKPVITTPTVSTSTLKTTTILTTPTVTTTVTTTTTTVSPTTTATTAKTTTSTASATTTLSTTTSATTSATTTVATSSTASTATTTIPTTVTTSSPPTTAATTADSGAGGECKATNGKPCIFPFKDGKEYNECKNEGGKYFWCATSVYDSGKYKHWSYCSTDGPCPLEGDGECRATNNKPCVFPFKDGNKEYNECADHGGKYFWCATGTNSAGKYTAWSECPKDGSCPLPQKSTTPPMTSTTTSAASTTPLPTGTTAATDQMEEKVLDTLENLVHGESRDDSLQMVHMLDKKLDTIIKDLEGEKSKTELSNSDDILIESGKLNQTIRRDQDEKVRDGIELGKGLMFVLSTVDSMKSVGRLSGDCCKDCTSKHSDTELAEYWETLDTCYCYKKFKNPDVEPKTRTSSKFTTKACATGVPIENCGRDEDVDSEHLIAEQNGPFIFKILNSDNSKDVIDKLYKTKVFPVFTSDGDGNLNFLMDTNKLPISGIFSAFLTPPDVKCEDNLIEKAIIANSEYFSLALEASLTKFDEILDDIPYRMKELKHYYNEKMPNICGTATYMSTETAESRALALKQIFSFLISPGEKFRYFLPNVSNMCKTYSATVNSIHSCGAFETNSQIKFVNVEITVSETDTFVEIPLTRELTGKKAIGFISAIPGYESLPEADVTDFVAYEGPVAFLAGSSKASAYISIKLDKKEESNEYFTIDLLNYEVKQKNRVWDNFKAKLLILAQFPLCQRNSDCNSRYKSVCNRIFHKCTSCYVNNDCAHIKKSAYTNPLRFIEKCVRVPNVKGLQEKFCAECLSDDDCIYGFNCENYACRQFKYMSKDGYWQDLGNEVGIYKLDNTPNFFTRCPYHKSSAQKELWIKEEDTLSRYSSWNNIENSQSILTQYAMRILELLLTKYYVKQPYDIRNYRRQLIAIADVVDEKGNHDLYISGNLDETMLSRRKYQREDIIGDILRIFRNFPNMHLVPYFPHPIIRHVFAINPDTITAGPKQSKEHAEMQIIQALRKYNYENFGSGHYKKMVSLHTNKPPCCACNSVLDKGQHGWIWHDYEWDDNDMLDFPFDGRIANAFSGPGSDLCIGGEECGSQWNIEKQVIGDPPFNGYWRHPSRIIIEKVEQLWP